MMTSNRHVRKNVFRNQIQQRQQQRVRQLRWVLRSVAGVSLALLASGMFIFGYDYLTQCNHFLAERVPVEGARRLTVDAVREQAQIQEGMNILAVNLSLVRKRLLSHPWIDEAEVIRELPNIILIRVREQTPLAVIDLGRKFIINDRGEIFKEWTDGDPENLTLVTGLGFADIRIPDRPVSRPFQAVLAVLELGRRPDAVLPNGQLRRIGVDREIGLTLHAYDSGKIIKMGYGGYGGKYRRLQSVLAYLARSDRGMEFGQIDLCNTHRIVLAPFRDATAATVHKEV